MQVYEKDRLIVNFHNIMPDDRYVYETDMWLKAMYTLTNTPTIEAEPVRHGRWIDSKYFSEICSVCFEDVEYTQECFRHRYAFCPNCGAKMDKGEE